MKVKLFTDSDLDGISCGIVAKVVYNKDVDIEYAHPGDINEKVQRFITNKEYLAYDHVYITDLSVSVEVAELIESEVTITPNKVHRLCNMVTLRDHHKTAEYLNNYDWAGVLVEVNGELTCGTSLFLNCLNRMWELSEMNKDMYDRLRSYCEIVRKYDTWLWQTKYNDVTPKQFNDLLYIIGRDEFVSKIEIQIKNEVAVKLNKFDLKLLEYRQRDIDKYIETKNKYIIKREIMGYNVGIVFSEMYTSELGNTLCKLNPDIDFVAMINPSYAVSYRGTGKVDVSVVAKQMGGGGHFSAGGNPINGNVKDKIIDLVFNL